ncbi:MAG TPA: XdhC family protein [Acidimicrobiia bacterium]|nr:XdhC family protein [Acidimicrobiia bacterium]
MNELDEIIETIKAWEGRPFAMATVVGVRGSTYRQLGARQLIDIAGISVGTVSGGCLDNDLHTLAAGVMATGLARLSTFDLTADDEAVWGWGIGCNGATELLVEPGGSAARWADQVESARTRHHPLAVLHWLAGPDGVGGRQYLEAGQEPRGVWEERASLALSAGEAEVAAEGNRRVFIEVIGAPPRLLVCGAGHDAVPLVRYADELGFDVVVVDDRRQFLTVERFPRASALVHARPGEVVSAVGIDPRTYAVIMSHNYLRDLEYLRALIGTDVAYIGTLGPGARLERLLKDLEASGSTVSSFDLLKLHGPAGLDVGAEGPAEIAWSVMAEILGLRRGCGGGSLRESKGPAALRSG